MVHIRTQIKDAILTDCTVETGKEITALEDVSMIATMEAIKSNNPLPYWETYNQVEL
jgi:hypothetical protein